LVQGQLNRKQQLQAARPSDQHVRCEYTLWNILFASGGMHTYVLTCYDQLQLVRRQQACNSATCSSEASSARKQPSHHVLVFPCKGKGGGVAQVPAPCYAQHCVSMCEGSNRELCY
jgi:hypothetical protein